MVITCGEWITRNKLATANRFLPNFLDFLDTSTLRTAEAMALWCSLKRTGKKRLGERPLPSARRAKTNHFISFYRYWIYDKNFQSVKASSPLSNFIKNKRTTRLDRIDAAMVWDGNSRVYFFGGNKYWRYNEEKKQIDPGYPLPASTWQGVKGPINGVFSWKNSRSFFFKGNDTIKFNNHRFAVHKGRPLRKFLRNC